MTWAFTLTLLEMTSHFLILTSSGAIAVNSANTLIISLMVILLIRLMPIVSNFLNRKNLQSFLNQAQQNLDQERVEHQAVTTALQDSEDRFRTIYNYAAIGIALIDRNGKILNANPAYDQILSYAATDTSDRFLTDQTHPEDLAGDHQAISKLFTKEYKSHQRTKRYLDSDGQIIWVNLTFSLVEPETTAIEPYAIAMIENITQRKQIETELLQTQAQLKERLQARTDQILLMNEELSWQNNHDLLTGLINRYTFERRLTQTIKSLHKQVNSKEHTLCHLNLDHFKVINKLGSSLAGDEILRQVSRIIENRCRQTDMIARLAADEFAILLYQCPLDQAEKVAQSIINRIQAETFHYQAKEYRISTSIGLVPINATSGNASEMIMAADAACYAAKRRGRSRIHVYESNDQELLQYRSEAQWIGKIEDALKNNTFVLYMQSIQPMKATAINQRQHCEILIRMVTEWGEVISPGEFLPAAERYHLITKIDCWVIENTLQYLAARMLTESEFHIYSINLSGASINDDSLVDFIRGQFAKYQVPTEKICFEVTETVAIANLSRAAEVIQSIRGMGCRIALDDFGAGMSSFSYLKYLPVDYLKIDGSFVKDIVDDPVNYAMVETMNRIGQVMGIETVAEYVANEQILEKIRIIGIDYGQGYGINRPAPLNSDHRL